MIEIPCISLWQPWAQWVMLGWKGIETRTHPRFQSLVGKRIGIHASVRWDTNWSIAARDYLPLHHIHETSRIQREEDRGGKLLCTVFVTEHRILNPREHEGRALIECSSVTRWGLFLSEIKKIQPAVPLRGKQGIFYIPGELCA